GFEDILELGDGTRQDLFALDPSRPRPLAAFSLPVPERMSAKGKPVYALDSDELRVAAFHAKEDADVAVVSFLNAWANDEHEAIAAALLKEAGFAKVVSATRESPELGFLRRTENAVAEAAIAPLIRDYIDSMAAELEGASSLSALDSAGGLVPAKYYRAAESLLSGPAGGAAGVAAIAQAFGEGAVLGLDMGGTSTDVVRWSNGFDYRYQTKVGDARVLAPSLAIETVAAGGGSICWWDGHALHVGPQSAGANPGPACYGAGGPLTLTDVNLLLRRVKAEDFSIPLAIDDAERALGQLMQESGSEDREALLRGLVAIADERMAEAIRQVSLRRGYDPADHALIAFGGAGGVHACAIAELLGVSRVVFPHDAGILSAIGLAQATTEASVDASVLRTLSDAQDALRAAFTDLEQAAIEECTRRGAKVPRLKRKLARLRLQGQDETLDLDVADTATLRDDFAKRWQEHFGYPQPSIEPEVVMLRVIACDESSQALPDGSKLNPTLATLYLPESWSSEQREHGLFCTRIADSGVAQITRPPAVERALFANRFTAIAEDMGETLRRSSLSTNIRERLDFSCALLDAKGELLVNAPHIPVHLGALGLCVRKAVEHTPLAEGETLLTNHPAFGGSHLPDFTLVSAAYHQGTLIGYVASRAHHAEIGGITPGSMPPNATTLAEEGVVIAPTKVSTGSALDADLVTKIFSEGPYPSRQPQDNLADLQAQLNANQRGVAALQALASTQGCNKLREQMAMLADHAEAEMRATLAALPDGTRDAMEELDDGTMLCVEVMIEGDHARVDFSGTSGVHASNLNATEAIVRSALTYVLRLLVGKDLPLNEGMLRPIEIHIPSPSILSPDFSVEPAPAVVGGNVETSQRLVDTLLKALGLAAASQGTMNNLIFGNDKFSYYETIPGGAGASAASHGASAMQVHMTNTRITDPELLVHRYPLRLERYGLRDDSGGEGRQRGGDGTVREFLFLTPVTLSFLSEHRKVAPFGLDGGGAGRVGEQYIVRPGGVIEALGGRASLELQIGDRFVVETPGGGGFGELT
ncbi:MAG: hydantoinase B/oxoprolinase family protein, partial [Planctomycetes bacterium]|nr:hydantoinase B/oxoprolinase family protein [Planctomycetota bacterium]